MWPNGTASHARDGGRTVYARRFPRREEGSESGSACVGPSPFALLGLACGALVFSLAGVSLVEVAHLARRSVVTGHRPDGTFRRRRFGTAP